MKTNMLEESVSQNPVLPELLELTELPGLVTQSSVLLSLFLPKAVVSDAVDCLMVQEWVINFNVTPVQGYGGLLKGQNALNNQRTQEGQNSQNNQDSLSVKEQVAGYQDKMHIQVLCPSEQVPAILLAIKASLPHTTVRYVIVPVLAMGQF